MKRIGGARRKTRNLFAHRKPGSITSIMQSFSQGDKVALVMNPSYHRGPVFRRFYGRVGTVVGKRGSCYEVAVSDKGKMKSTLLHPAHMKRLR